MPDHLGQKDQLGKSDQEDLMARLDRKENLEKKDSKETLAMPALPEKKEPSAKREFKEKMV